MKVVPSSPAEKLNKPKAVQSSTVIVAARR